jgi:mRNA-degrading endonuclease toxin of MazEF toxin-antitoxin module
MNGEALPRRGEVGWLRADKRRPVVVVCRRIRCGSPGYCRSLSCLTTRLHLAELPGNVRFDRRSTGLPKASVANVYDVQKVLRSDFMEAAGALAHDDLSI